MSHRTSSKPFVALLVALFATAGLAVVPTPAGAVGTGVATVVTWSSPNPSEVAEQVTITASVTGGSPAPTGTVTFKSGDVVLGADLIESGVAQAVFVFTLEGEASIRAEYSGDDNYAAVVSAPHTHVVDDVTRKTWVGQGGNWSNPANWDTATAPVDGDTLVFDGPAGGAAMVNDIADLDLAHISMVDGTISGVAATLSGHLLSTSSSASTVALPLALPAGSHTVDGNHSLTGVVSGSGGVVKTGPSTVNLHGVNTYGGATQVKGGVLRGHTPTAFGNSSGDTSVSDGAGAVIVTSSAQTIAEPFSLAGQGPSADLGALTVQGPAQLNGPLALTGDKVEVRNHGTVHFSPINGSSTALVKTGFGTAVFNAANTFKSLEFETGTVQTDVAGGLGSGPVTLGDDGASLDAVLSLGAPPNGTRLFTNPISSTSGSAVVKAIGPGTVALSGAISLGGSVQFEVGPGGLIVSGAVSGGGGHVKTGEGLIYYGGSAGNTGTSVVSVADGAAVGGKTAGNSFPAGANVAADSVLALEADNQIGDTAPVTVAANGTFDTFGSSDAIGTLTSAGAVFLGVIDDAGPDYSVLQVGGLQLNGGMFAVTVGGTGGPGTGHDQVKSPSVKVGGALYVDGDVPFGSTVKIIDNTGGSAVSGTFAGLAEGATVQTANGNAVISYKGGDGNDVTLSRAAARSGYWMMDQSGKVYPFGDAKHYGNAYGMSPGVVPVDIEPVANYDGYWILLSNGAVSAHGNAPFWGGAQDYLDPGEVATSISNDGYNNYWIFTDRGRAFEFEDAGWYGDMEGFTLNGPVLGSVSTPSGEGYYMVASDGGIFAFGDATFRGSMGGKPLNGPVMGLAPDPDNDGYWLVATDGGIFAFNSSFRGSMGGKPLNKPVIGMVAYGDGYLMVASDGGIFNFSSKPFVGSLGKTPPPVPVVAVAPLNEG